MSEREKVVVGSYRYTLRENGWTMTHVDHDYQTPVTWPHTVEMIQRIREMETLLTTAERERDAMRAVVEAADVWEVARVQATAARMVAGATGGPVPAPTKSETLANMRLVSVIRAYRAATAQTGEP